MSLILKHFILFFCSFLILISSLYLPYPAENANELKDVKMGYPLSFVSQNFTEKYQKQISFFPRWQKFDLDTQKVPFEFYFGKFAVSLSIVFLAVEFLIYVLEIIDFKIRKIIFRKKQRHLN
jgi:hypothetical protein